MRRRIDAAQIEAFVHELAQEPWLGEHRCWWPYRLFHVTDIHNVVSIIKHGQLYSRNEVEARGLMRNENASRSHIYGTDPWVKDYVRLYFRPRTKTFVCNEGIRPVEKRRYESSCPLPVALLFNSREVLSIEGVQFSDGNLARRSKSVSDGVDFLRSLPFQFVYRDPQLDPAGPSLNGLGLEERDRLQNHRHAEVLVPTRLPLRDYLSDILVRSEAERETLRTLLADEGELDYAESLCSICIAPPRGVFFKRWTFVERANRTREGVLVQFNPNSKTPGPFDARFEFYDCDDEDACSYGTARIMANRSMTFLPDDYFRNAPCYRFRLLLDGCLALENNFGL